MGQESEAQFCFQFEESTESVYSAQSDHSDPCDDEGATIFSFAGKQAQKANEKETRLYDGILERVKHLYS
jgi:hypothetical protein